jgi:hypothetical protein
MMTVDAPDVSTAWITAAEQLLPERKAIHTVVRIADPVAEVPQVRQAVDALLDAQHLQCVETVANTIFPVALAAGSRDHAELVERYTRMGPVLRRFSKNRLGTYFGRLIQYPTPQGPFDQIGAVIKRIGIERAGGRAKQARYEATLAAEEVYSSMTPTYVPGQDNSAMAFPCLSHCSFQLDNDGRVHLLATYRSQFVVQRGYGNYLGLGRLLAYVAERAGLATGQLTVVAGLAHLENPILPVRALVQRFSQPA